MMKLSTATGYIYGYVQDINTGMWQYIVLDFETGETVFTMDIANKYGYNNMAIGMYAGDSGNALYCPTGYLELLRLQDRFVYLPEMPYREADLDLANRNVLSQEDFEAARRRWNSHGLAEYGDGGKCTSEYDSGAADERIVRHGRRPAPVCIWSRWHAAGGTI